MANHATDKIETHDVREAFARLVREMVPAEVIAKTIAEGMTATETKFFSHEGVVQDKREVPAWSERRQYAELAAEYGGFRMPDRREIEEPGGVILILPDGPRTTPTSGQPPVEGTVIDNLENGGPILILPGPKPEEDPNG
jgi:hypothetical protein